MKPLLIPKQQGFVSFQHPEHTEVLEGWYAQEGHGVSTALSKDLVLCAYSIWLVILMYLLSVRTIK